jgi:hypothetical protein
VKPKASQQTRGVKTSVEIPERVWRAARMRAIDERGGLRGVIVRALEAYLQGELKGIPRSGEEELRLQE